MQDKKDIKENKKILLNALAKTIKELRGEQTQFQFATENDISTDIISKCERGLKDPQFTTLYKIAEGFDLNFAEFALKIQQNIPQGINLIEK